MNPIRPNVYTMSFSVDKENLADPGYFVIGFNLAVEFARGKEGSGVEYAVATVTVQQLPLVCPPNFSLGTFKEKRIFDSYYRIDLVPKTLYERQLLTALCRDELPGSIAASTVNQFVLDHVFTHPDFDLEAWLPQLSYLGKEPK